MCAAIQHAKRMENRIKELREARGWSMRKLAEALNTSASTVNKLEKGITALNVHWMEKLAAVFDVSIDSLLVARGREPRGFFDDASPYSGPDMPPTIALDDTQFAYEVKTNSLDQLGLLPGTMLIVDMSSKVTEELATGDIVVAQIYDGLTARTVLRQFISPSLLITNASEKNAPILNLRHDDVNIKGVVVAAHSAFRRGRPKS